MLTRVDIQNYRSIWQATVKLSPFTLLVGANGTGKSNFLRLLRSTADYRSEGRPPEFLRHINHISEPTEVVATESDIGAVRWNLRPDLKGTITGYAPALSKVAVFQLNPENAGTAEALTRYPTVGESGSGVVQVLDALKTGPREDLFETVERTLGRFIPEIEKLSFIPGENTKRLQVKEKHIEQPIPVAELSEGTKLVLTILTIVYQERPPTLICLEDIDRGMHPRLFERVLHLCFDLTAQPDGPQIIATTHNPYLVDQFKGREEAVVIVEKENGETSFTTLADRLKELGPEEQPLGELWYSGLVGGVPKAVL